MSVASSVANDKLTELRMKKKQAIQALNFDLAEEYDKQIAETNQYILTDRINKINEDIIKELTEHYAKNETVKKEIDAVQKKQETSIRASYQSQFERVQKQNEKESKSIEKAHATALLREAETEVPEQMEKLEEAKELANKGDYQGAKKMMAEARTIGEQALAARKTKVDNEFAQSMSILATKQQEEMDQLESQYEQEMEQLAQDINIRKEDAENRYQNGIDLIRERAKIRCNALLADDQTKEEAYFNLNQRINDTLIALENSPSEAYSRPYSARSTRSSSRYGRSTKSISSTKATGNPSNFDTPKSRQSSSMTGETPSGSISPRMNLKSTVVSKISDV